MQNPSAPPRPMNTPRLLIVVSWVASLVVAYFIGASGNRAQHPGTAISAEAPGTGAAANSTREVDARAEETAESTKREKRDVRLLIAKARLEMGSGMGGMMNIRGMLRAIAPLADLDDAQIQEALGEVEKSIREPQQKMMLYSLLLGQWAETDGRAALTYAQAKLDKGSMFDMGVTFSVLGSWARRDPEAAWKWFSTEQQDDGTDRTRMMALSSIFAGLAANNLDSALARAGTLDEQSRGMALGGIASGMSDDASRRRLLARTSPSRKISGRRSAKTCSASGRSPTRMRR